ncbi:MAG TPA: hypothetical protein VMX58_04025 [Patescibacteria group bacterium]|nr:hypothetical protein [Patescibacteria group bacterium]
MSICIQKWIIIPITVFTVCVAAIDGAAERHMPSDLLDAARSEAISFVTVMRERLITDGTIDRSDELDDLKLGTPYPKYLLRREDLPRLDPGNFKEVLVQSHWVVPVFFGENPRFLLYLRECDGEWKSVDAGGDPTPMLDAMRRWKQSDGFELSYVKAPWGPDFIMIERKGVISLYSFRERNERLFGISRDENGMYPLLTVPFVVSRIKESERAYLEKLKRE